MLEAVVTFLWKFREFGIRRRSVESLMVCSIISLLFFIRDDFYPWVFLRDSYYSCTPRSWTCTPRYDDYIDEGRGRCYRPSNMLQTGYGFQICFSSPRPCPITYYDVVQKPQYFILLNLAPIFCLRRLLRRLLRLPAHACSNFVNYTWNDRRNFIDINFVFWKRSVCFCLRCLKVRLYTCIRRLRELSRKYTHSVVHKPKAILSTALILRQGIGMQLISGKERVSPNFQGN